MNSADDILSKISSTNYGEVDRAVLLISLSKIFQGVSILSMSDVCNLFEKAHLSRPNSSRLKINLSKDKRISVRNSEIKALLGADQFLKSSFPEFFNTPEKQMEFNQNQLDIISETPLLDDKYKSDLLNMAELYTLLHSLENSMRKLIEMILKKKYDESWWDTCASSAQKSKHEGNKSKESKRKWLPARGDLGPLYYLDWSDLISLMRAQEAHFLPVFGEVKFFHRFEDLGLLRHVVAHNGFIENFDEEMQRVKIAHRDWKLQVGGYLENN